LLAKFLHIIYQKKNEGNEIKKEENVSSLDTQNDGRDISPSRDVILKSQPTHQQTATEVKIIN